MKKKHLILISVFAYMILSFQNSSETKKMNSIEEEIWKSVKAHNRAWAVLEDPVEQAKFVHESILLITPSEREPFDGKESYMESYKNWYKAVKVHHLREKDPIIRIFAEGKAAVVYYTAEMSFNYIGNENTFKGRDLMFLVYEKGKWLIAADKFSSFPEK